LIDDGWITIVVLVATFGALVLDRYPPSAVVLSATVSLLVFDVINPSQAFAGFSNPAPITVAALFILAAGAQRTGLLSAVVGRLLGAPQRRGVAHARLLVPAALASAALNNTPLVAILIPDILAWARRHRRNASRYLLPLSYAVILGGTLTVLGTSTNLVVSGLLEDAGEEPLRMFEMAKIGLPVFAVGMLVLFSMSIPLLPNRVGAPEQLEASTKEFLVEMRVTHDRSVAGRTVEAAGLRGLTGVYLVRVRRDGRTIAPVAPDERLEVGDVLAFAGDVSNVLDLQRMRGLEGLDNDTIAAMDVAGRGLYEVVVGRMSPVAGHRLRDSDFRGQYDAAVLAVHRAGHRIEEKLGDVRLRHGDTLVVVAGADFRSRWALAPDFLVVAELDAAVPTAGPKAPVVALAMIGFVVFSSLGWVTTVEGSLLAAGAIVVTRVLTFSEAKRAIDVDVILLIGAAFGLGAAVEQSGLAAEIADGFVGALGGYGTFGLALAIVLATSVLTEIITNNAAAVVVFPIALAIAGPAGIDIRIMAIAVATAASTSFLSPIGYQTNTMVYGPGGYRMSDYVRAGLPLTIAVQLTTATMVTVLG
jgi:di/tricarboxylate transporter